TVAAVLMLPGGVRSDGVVVGITLTLVLVPATLRLLWAAGPAVLVAGAVAIGFYGLAARSVRAAWLRVGAATLLGGYATLVSLARPSAAAITLTTIAVAGVLIGVAPWLEFAAGGRPTEIVTEAALGGAAFALPGAVAFATAAMAVTTGAIAAVARVAALLVPRYPLATAAAVVLAVALGVRALPVGLRRGPTVGATLVGGVIAVVSGLAALIGGVNALRANTK